MASALAVIGLEAGHALSSSTRRDGKEGCAVVVHGQDGLPGELAVGS
jgi:hypothetical protein